MNPAPENPNPPPGMGFRAFVALIALLMAVNALAIDSMLPALPAIGAALGVVAENDRQWIITAYLLGFGVAQLAYGPLSDRYGRRPVLLFGLGVFVVFSVVAAFASLVFVLYSAEDWLLLSLAIIILIGGPIILLMSLNVVRPNNSSISLIPSAKVSRECARLPRLAVFCCGRNRTSTGRVRALFFTAYRRWRTNPGGRILASSQ